jgi:hypothetical protein
VKIVIKKIFSNKLATNIIPIGLLNIIILLFQLIENIREELIQLSILLPFCNTLFVFIINIIFVYKEKEKYFFKYIILMIISCFFSHILSLINWCIWRGNNLHIYNWKNLHFFIFTVILNILLICIIGLIIQVFLLIKSKRRKLD